MCSFSSWIHGITCPNSIWWNWRRSSVLYGHWAYWASFIARRWAYRRISIHWRCKLLWYCLWSIRWKCWDMMHGFGSSESRYVGKFAYKILRITFSPFFFEYLNRSFLPHPGSNDSCSILPRRLRWFLAGRSVELTGHSIAGFPVPHLLLHCQRQLAGSWKWVFLPFWFLFHYDSYQFFINLFTISIEYPQIPQYAWSKISHTARSSTAYQPGSVLRSAYVGIVIQKKPFRIWSMLASIQPRS